MATAFTTPHPTMTGLSHHAARETKTSKPGAAATFFQDLWEDINQRPLQAAHLARHDMFREHINAMSISYFALIVLLIGISIPMLVALVPFLTN